MWEISNHLVGWLSRMHGQHPMVEIYPHNICIKVSGLLLGDHTYSIAMLLILPTETACAVDVVRCTGVL